VAKFNKHRVPRRFFKESRTFCKSCRLNTEHKIHFAVNRHLCSQCEECHREVTSSHPVTFVLGESLKTCASCAATTLHFQYEAASQLGYWMCSSCGAEAGAH
jgi:hypothetical protein